MTDLNDLPFPVRNAEDLKNVDPKFLYIIAGRGCYGKCSFCSSQICFNYQYKIYRDPKDIVNEIEELVNTFKITYFRFQDDIFFDRSINSKKWVNNFINEIKNRKLNITFRIYLRTNDVDDEIIKKLKGVGLIEVFLGIETGIDRILKEMNKKAIVSDSYKAISILEDNDIDIEIGFITIVPTMSFEELKENYNFLFRIGHYEESNIHNRLNVFTGCEYVEILAKQNLLIPKENFWDRQEYKFIDKRVELFHNNLQKIKEYADKVKKKLVIYKKSLISEDLINDNSIDNIELKYLKLWEEVIYVLIEQIENDIINLGYIYRLFDEFMNSHNLLKKVINKK